MSKHTLEGSVTSGHWGHDHVPGLRGSLPGASSDLSKLSESEARRAKKREEQEKEEKRKRSMLKEQNTMSDIAAHTTARLGPKKVQHRKYPGLPGTTVVTPLLGKGKRKGQKIKAGRTSGVGAIGTAGEGDTMAEFIMVDEARGKGQGKGGPRQGDGGATWDVCPVCGYKVKHTKGVPAQQKECPKCGEKMVGEQKKPKMVKCPVCGTPVPAMSGYCIVCKKKTVKVSKEQDEGKSVAPSKLKKSYYDMTDEERKKWLTKQLASKRASHFITVAKTIKHSGKAGLLFYDPQYDSIIWIADDADVGNDKYTDPSVIASMFMKDPQLKNARVEIGRDLEPKYGPWVQLYPVKRIRVPEKHMSVSVSREAKEYQMASEADHRQEQPYPSQQQVREDSHSIFQCQSCHNQIPWKRGVDLQMCPRCGAVMERKIAPEYNLLPGVGMEQERSDFSSDESDVDEVAKLGVIDKPLSPSDKKIAALDPGERMRLDVLVLSMLDRKKTPPKDYVKAVEEEYKIRVKSKSKLSAAEKRIARGLKKHGITVPAGLL